MKFLTYIIISLWFLFQFLVEINCQMTPFKPKQRDGATATLIDNKLYILGGNVGSTTVNDFFILMSLLLILKNYHGKNYQTLTLSHRIMVLHLSKVEQTIIHCSYMEATTYPYLLILAKWHWFIHIIHKIIRGVSQK